MSKPVSTRDGRERGYRCAAFALVTVALRLPLFFCRSSRRTKPRIRARRQTPPGSLFYVGAVVTNHRADLRVRVLGGGPLRLLFVGARRVRGDELLIAETAQRLFRSPRAHRRIAYAASAIGCRATCRRQHGAVPNLPLAAPAFRHARSPGEGGFASLASGLSHGRWRLFKYQAAAGTAWAAAASGRRADRAVASRLTALWPALRHGSDCAASTGFAASGPRSGSGAGSHFAVCRSSLRRLWRTRSSRSSPRFSGCRSDCFAGVACPGHFALA